MSFPTGAAGLRAARLEHPDVVVFGLPIPDFDIVDAFSQIRAWSSVPIVLLGDVDDVRERVRALRAGADDYLVKPFDPEELDARIEAVLRRSDRAQTEIRFEDLLLDMGRRRCVRAGTEIPLTPIEFSILETLARLAERVISRLTLASVVWPEAEVVDDRLLDTHVAHLRSKLEAGGGRRLIHTVRGVGLSLR